MEHVRVGSELTLRVPEPQWQPGDNPRLHEAAFAARLALLRIS